MIKKKSSHRKASDHQSPQSQVTLSNDSSSINRKMSDKQEHWNWNGKRTAIINNVTHLSDSSQTCRVHWPQAGAGRRPGSVWCCRWGHWVVSTWGWSGRRSSTRISGPEGLRALGRKCRRVLISRIMFLSSGIPFGIYQRKQQQHLSWWHSFKRIIMWYWSGLYSVEDNLCLMFHYILRIFNLELLTRSH